MANDLGISILARGPWAPEAIYASWREEHYAPGREAIDAADAKIAALRERGSPSHDGVSGRLVDFVDRDGELHFDLQPIRWALRLLDHDAHGSMAALCVTRAADGRWLAGRRAAWLSTWPGRWALGAGGAVDPEESPAETLVRELGEEWNVVPERVQGEVLVRLPHGMVMFVGQAWLTDGAEITMDDEHDAYAWWPADPHAWPPEADEPLRQMALLLG